MEINGTIFSKPQRDQLERGIGAELDKVAAKIDDVDKRMLNYMGDWVENNDYHQNDIVSYNGQLYEVISDHNSGGLPIPPKNTNNYAPMTKTSLRTEEVEITYYNTTYSKISAPSTYDFYGMVDGMVRYFKPIGRKEASQSFYAYAISIYATNSELYVYFIEQRQGAKMIIRKISIADTVTFTEVTAPTIFTYRTTD